MKIGIVLAGGANNGIYEIGCIKAIAEKFSIEDIVCISGSSIGSLVASSFASDQLDSIIKTLKAIDTNSAGRFFPSFAKNQEVFVKIQGLISEDTPLKIPTYITLWNYTDRKTEYVCLNNLSLDDVQNYLLAAVAVPIVNKGVKINGNVFFDGAFVDNIPVYPLLQKDLDIIFCIYFENRNYLFENEDFNKKVVKMADFPRPSRYDTFVFDSKRVDSMIDYGYEYTKKIISYIDFDNTEKEMYESIERVNEKVNSNIKYRLTADSSLSAINKIMARFAKRNIL